MALKLEFGQLDEANNTVDITKLLVAYALRIGAVTEKTWEELVRAVVQRPNKRFIWTTPEWPVFFALTRSERLDFPKPARADQQGRFLKHAASLVGMLQRPVSHDVRRGAAADIASLKDSINVEGVRRSLGHTNAARGMGITDKYMGRLKGDSWAARIEGSANAPDDEFGVQFAPTAFVKRKLATKDIDNWCKTKNVDAKDRNNRYRARKELEEAQYSQWVAYQTTTLESPSTGVASSPNESLDTAPIDPALLDHTVLDPAPERTPLPGITNVSQPLPAMKGKDDASVPSEGIADSTITSMLHTLGLEDADASNELSDAAVGMMSEQFVSLLVSGQSAEQPRILTSHIHDFISYFSSINLISISSASLPRDVETGNSRLPPSKFLHLCRKEGFTRSYYTNHGREQH